MTAVPSNPAHASHQQNLTTLGVATPPLVVDGIQGQKTTAAVKRFQTAHGLTVDGIAGQQTNAAIALALSGQSPASSPAVSTSPPGPTQLVPGAGSVAVVTVQDVQRGLNTLGVSDPPLVVDGKAGQKTQAAVKLFQMKAGLTIDGIAGPLTKAALGKALATVVPPAAATSSGAAIMRRVA
jgi:peptidoglycan hydrolase-like protein with peptidoglycan-binding domain